MLCIPSYTGLGVCCPEMFSIFKTPKLSLMNFETLRQFKWVPKNKLENSIDEKMHDNSKPVSSKSEMPLVAVDLLVTIVQYIFNVY